MKSTGKGMAWKHMVFAAIFWCLLPAMPLQAAAPSGSDLLATQGDVLHVTLKTAAGEAGSARPSLFCFGTSWPAASRMTMSGAGPKPFWWNV